MKVKFGIIGCSSVAKRKTIPAILHSNFASLEMVGSRSLEKAKEWGKSFGCASGSYKDVLQNPSVEAIYISLPIRLHPEWALQSIQAGKHVLCEKSATDSFARAQVMVQEAKKRSLRLMEAFMFRFHPQHKRILEWKREGLFGEIFSFEGNYGLQAIERTGFRFDPSLGGGCLNDAGCYIVCASRMIFGSVPEGVMASLKFDLKTGVDLQGSFYLVYPGHRTAFGGFGYENCFRSTYHVWGNKASAYLQRAYALKPNSDSILHVRFADDREEITTIPWVDQSQLMIDEFSQVIRGEKKESFSYEEDLLQQSKVMEAIRISARENRLVSIKELNLKP
ncbi:MAG: Gfo/Idh/MocA family oxidoreductase [Deltaproteobacteria bacterium]|nr:Gfo/Idh/MocA family oxidoreductase [Deltaproteobacteria bacterium]